MAHPPAGHQQLPKDFTLLLAALSTARAMFELDVPHLVVDFHHLVVVGVLFRAPLLTIALELAEETPIFTIDDFAVDFGYFIITSLLVRSRCSA
jgi:hypothetical protein